MSIIMIINSWKCKYGGRGGKGPLPARATAASQSRPETCRSGSPPRVQTTPLWATKFGCINRRAFCWILCVDIIFYTSVIVNLANVVFISFYCFINSFANVTIDITAQHHPKIYLKTDYRSCLYYHYIDIDNFQSHCCCEQIIIIISILITMLYMPSTIV